MELFILLGLSLVIYYFVKYRQSTSGNRLPGPIGIPFLGCPWIVFQDLRVVLTDMIKTWGRIFMVNICGLNILVLTRPDDVREAFAAKEGWENYSGRPTAPLENPNLSNGIVFMDASTQWSKQRRLIHQCLHHYGDGLSEFEHVIQEELNELSSVLEENGQEVIDLEDYLYHSVTNVIAILLKGRRYDYNGPVLTNVMRSDKCLTRGGSLTYNLLFTVLPFVKYIPYGPGRLYSEDKTTLRQFNKDFFEESKATYEPHVTRGMIDFLLHHQRESCQSDGSVWLEDKHIKGITQDMITAGSVTTSIFLYAFFLLMVQKPDEAKKIQTEIDQVIGRGRPPCLEDRKKMPYTMASYYELLRYISHVPLGIPHVLRGDVSFKGFHLNAGTVIMANLFWIHHDPENYPDPWEYKPERFLDDDGDIVPVDHINRKNLLPFGIGRRSCVGEMFAKSRTFLFITTLLQRFNFTIDPSGTHNASFDPRTFKPGLAIGPKPYKVRVTLRSGGIWFNERQCR